MKKIFQYGVLLALAALTCGAQQSKVYQQGDSWIEEVSGTLAQPAHNLKLITDMGSVHVEGGNQGNVSYTVRKRVRAGSEQEARRAFEMIRVSAGSQGDWAWIRGQASERQKTRSFSAEFSVQVPRGLELVKAETGGGSLEVKAISGRVEAETGGGSMHLDDIGGGIEARSGGGNVEVGYVAQDARLETGGGSIHIRAVDGNLEAQSGGGNIQIDEGKASMTLHTGGGSIQVNKCGGDLEASTGGGVISAGNVAGKADLETGGGSIRLASAGGPVHAESGGGSVELYKLSSGVQAETGSGGIVAEFVGTGPEFRNSRLETAAGDIRVFLPQNLPVSVYAAIDVSDGHAIHSDFSALKVTSEGEGYGPRETYCRGDLNGGGPKLHVHTATGNIDFLQTASTANRKPH